MRRVLAALLAAHVAGAALAVAVGSPAAAENGADGHEVAISSDGVHYQQAIAEPLFDPTLRWVPGDVQVRRFWVRNQADEAGDLTIDLVPRTRRTLFRSGYLTVSARADDGRWRPVRSGTPLRLLSADDVPAATVVPVSIRVRLAPEAPNGTMVLATDFDVRVTLVDARAGGQGNGFGGPGGVLPGTGATASWWVVPLGVLLVAVGALLLARREPSRLPVDLDLPGGI